MKILIKPVSNKTLFLAIIMIASTLLATSTGIHRATASDNVGSGGGATQTPATFTSYELGGNPFNTPNFGVGTVCPNAAGNCQNSEGEPAIRADPSGNFYGSSENVFCVILGLCGGTFAWSSTDGGAHFNTLALPNSVSSGSVPPTCNPNTDHCNGPGLSPAGGDTDIAVASRRNANGFYNIYVASLQSKPPLLNIYVSTSKDGGLTWSVNPTGASLPVDDREWIVADGANKVCISYHATGSTNEIVIDCSYDAGLTFTQHALAFDKADQFNALFNNEIGNLAIDTRNHVIYQVFSSIHDVNEQVACGVSCHTHTVWIAVSSDGGKTFTDYVVYNNLDTSVDYGHQFVNVSVDRGGNVYVVYNDDHNLFYSFSKTFGQTWSGKIQINSAPSNTAIFPWSTGGAAGALDVVWYGTDYCCAGTAFGGGSGPTYYPQVDTSGHPVVWYVYFAQNLQATTLGSTFAQVKASGIVHYGDICELGANCNSPMNRDLLDDFGVAASPTTGLAAIIYTNDQFLNTAAEPATRRNSGSYVCTASLSNSVDCSHTDIAIQTGGSTLNQNQHHFETDEEDFEELDLSNGGNHSPHFEMEGTNTGSVAITSVTAQINGLPLNLAWNTAYPLQPGQTAIASTTSVPSTLLLAIGNIYTVTITTTLADGSTETQTTSAIYTLGAGIGL